MTPRGRRGAVDPTGPIDGTPTVDGRGESSHVAEHAVDGLALGEAATIRSGEDVRRRGWFWHWNSVVTQYAPLIGLKGVGLLNSYTVWTDRREESPHRGYAFPSQQREADFYGEDRAELITINKILVALDLIEIRKEMVLRTDPQGRRWRVPHNFYRVKDHADGFTLGSRDVLAVAALADRDKAVYRYVRRVFSPRFAPIDADNVWHQILPEVRRTDLWQRLSERAAREEDRASARTRAGHAARRATIADAAEDDLFVPSDVDDAAPGDTQNDSAADVISEGPRTVVATTNRGSAVDVEAGNDGFDRGRSTSVGPTNVAPPTAVAPTNTTYHQSDLTTTTTPAGAPNDEPSTPRTAPTTIGAAAEDETNRQSPPATGDQVVPVPALAGTTSVGGPAGAAPPADAPAELAAIRAFEEANARRSTPAERTLLRGLAERFDPVARAAAAVAPAVPGSGWAWLAAAVYEAVEAGSAFVAPRRLREILLRWERDGYPPTTDDRAARDGRGGAGAGTRPETAPVGGRQGRPPKGADDGEAGEGKGRSGRESGAERGPAPVDLLGDGPDLVLPHGHGSRRTWAYVVGLLGQVVGRSTLAELVAGSAIVGYRDGEVTIAVPDARRAERLATTHRDLIARKLGEAMRRPVRVAILTTDADASGDAPIPAAAGEAGRVRTSAPATDRAAAGPRPGTVAPEPEAPTFLVAECGLTNGQVWAAVLAELMAGGAVGRADFEAWLRATALVGRGGDGSPGAPLVVGVPHALAQRRLTARFLPAIRAAVATVVGAPLPVEVVVGRDWLAAAAPAPAPSRDEFRRVAGA